MLKDEDHDSNVDSMQRQLSPKEKTFILSEIFRSQGAHGVMTFVCLMAALNRKYCILTVDFQFR